jgi:hypothetical protein
MSEKQACTPGPVDSYAITEVESFRPTSKSSTIKYQQKVSESVNLSAQMNPPVVLRVETVLKRRGHD